MINGSALEFGRVVFDVLLMSSLKAAALIVPVWLALLLVRRRRPALQHGVWAAVLWGMLLLPALSALSLVPALTSNVMVQTAIPAPAIALQSGAEVPAIADGSGSTVDWRGIAGLLSVLVTSILLVKSLLARRRALQLIDRANAISQPDVKLFLRSLLEEVKLGQTPRLLCSPEVETPVTFGCIRSVLLLPAAWPNWSKEKLRAVLLHELSHIARRDGWVLATASFNAAVFWFHPLALWLHRQLRLLAEMACDDHAIMVARDPEGYAETLLEIAACRQKAGTLPATASAMAHTPRISRRIERILKSHSFQSGMLRGAVRRGIAVAVLSATVLLSLVSVTLAQRGGVVLSGAVQDVSGARIPGASLLIIDSARSSTEATTTGADGSYRLEGLMPSAAYEIEVQANGFATHNQVVDLTADKQLDITLDVGRIQEMLVISGERPPADSSRPRTPASRIRVGGNVQRAKLVQSIKPIYPADAEKEGVEGTVLLEAVISTQGEPIALKAINTVVDPRLSAAALEAVRWWRYNPVLLNGQPVEVVTTISVVFQLP